MTTPDVPEILAPYCIPRHNWVTEKAIMIEIPDTGDYFKSFVTGDNVIPFDMLTARMRLNDDDLHS